MSTSVISEADAVEIAQPRPSKRDIGDPVAVEAEIDRDPVAAERVVALRGMGRVLERAEIARVAAVIEDDVLIKLAQIHHHRNISRAASIADGQPVDVALVVVDAERSAHGPGEAELVHQRLRAMVADAHRDAVLVEHGADIVRVHAVDIEREDAEPPLAAARPAARPAMRDRRSTP